MFLIMRQPAFLFCFIILSISGYSQANVESIVGNDFPAGFNPVDEIQLFDRQEIKKRGFTTAYIVYHPPAWKMECSYDDTLSIFRFDREGRIAEETQLKTLGMFGTTWIYDTLGNWTKRVSIRKYEDGRTKKDTSSMNIRPDSNSRYSIIRQKFGTDSLITSVFFEEFDTVLDTAMVFISRYDSKHRIIEYRDYETKKYTDALGCATDSHHHLKYSWDEKNRLIYYDNMLGSTYKRISYPPYGKLTETYDRKTGKQVDLEPKFVSNSDGVITISTSSSQITLVPLERKSKLYKVKAVASAVASIDNIPEIEYYEIIYK
jgi:hypothetical protein